MESERESQTKLVEKIAAFEVFIILSEEFANNYLTDY
jgi:hypothetical protein